MQRQAPQPKTSVSRVKRSVASWAVPLVGLTVVYVTLVATVRNQYYQLMLTLVPVWATLGISWNILSGYSGLVSFGHAAFFGLGAYTLTILFVFFGITPWIGLPLAGLAGAIAGLIIGYPTFRLRGHYFALVDARLPTGNALRVRMAGAAGGVAAHAPRRAGSLHAVQRQPHLRADGAGADDCGAAGVAEGGTLALRHVAPCHQAERDRGRGSRNRLLPLEAQGHRRCPV